MRVVSARMIQVVVNMKAVPHGPAKLPDHCAVPACLISLNTLSTKTDLRFFSVRVRVRLPGTTSCLTSPTDWE